LWSNNIPFSSCQLKSDRSFRIVVKGLNSSTDPEDIKADLDAAGHVVCNDYIPLVRTMVRVPGAQLYLPRLLVPSLLI